jgi:exopolyphosphatase/guanosine-5'-triphosphate,3'-diphosphate pyrophosphatase
MNLEQRQAQPCVGPGRADLVVAGCAILEAIRRTWPCEKLRVADRGVREGLLLSLMRWDDHQSRKGAPGGATA